MYVEGGRGTYKTNRDKQSRGGSGQKQEISCERILNAPLANRNRN